MVQRNVVRLVQRQWVTGMEMVELCIVSWNVNEGSTQACGRWRNVGRCCVTHQDEMNGWMDDRELGQLREARRGELGMYSRVGWKPEAEEGRGKMQREERSGCVGEGGGSGGGGGSGSREGDEEYEEKGRGEE